MTEATVLDGVLPDEVLRERLTLTTFRTTRPDHARFASFPVEHQTAPAAVAPPVRLIQIGPLDV